MLGRAPTRHLGFRFVRYSLGSVVAVITSEAAFVACYGTRLLGTTASSAVAFVAGAIPNYALNRSWAWGRRGRVRVGREVILYLVVSTVSFAGSALATGLTSRAAPRVTASPTQRTALVAASYLATYGVLFVVKFVLYQRVVFPDADGPTPGRRATRSSG